jgi:hypothetical protein
VFGTVTAEGKTTMTLPPWGTAFLVTIVKVYSVSAPVIGEVRATSTDIREEAEAEKVMESLDLSMR